MFKMDDSMVRIILNILEHRDQPAPDQAFFNRFLSLIRDYRGTGDKFDIRIDLFYECLRRLIATNGATNSVYFLMRNGRLIDRWRLVWSLLQQETSVLEYCGTDSSQTYVLAVMLQSATDLIRKNILLVPYSPQHQSIGSMCDYSSSSSDLGIYGFVETAPASSASAISLEKWKTPDHGESSQPYLNEDDRDPSHWEIPSALHRRYETQASFIGINRYEQLRQGAWMNDPDAATVVSTIFDQLASVERDENESESVIASPEMLKLLYLIDRYAISHGTDHGAGLPLDTLKRLLVDDQSLLNEAYALLKEVDGITKSGVAVLVRFIVDISSRSIWKMAAGYSRSDRRNASFRTEVQLARVNGRNSL